MVHALEFIERTSDSRESISERRARPHRFTLFVPSLNDDGPIPIEAREQALVHCREVICRICGGATEWEARGYWMGQNGFASERITVITAFVSRDSKQVFVKLRKLCRWMKIMLKQEKVAFEVDSKLYLI